MRAHPARATLFAIAVVVLLVAVVPSFPREGGRTPSSAPPSFGGTGLRPGLADPIPHSSLSSSAPAPTAATPPGEQFGAEYEVAVPNYTSSIGTGTVDLPNVLVRIPTSSGSLHLYLDAANVSVTNARAVDTGAIPLTRIPEAVTFNASGFAQLSSQGLAVMASWPYGGPNVAVRWHWTGVGPDGSATAGAWSNWTYVEPAQAANLGAPIDRTWTIGASYQLCLTGALGGRTFVLHVATTNPVSQIDAGTATGPAGATPLLCWNSTVPASTAPQAAVVHLWETDGTTFLLYSFAVDLAVPSTSTVPQNGTAATTSMAPIVGGAVVLGGLVLLGYVVVLRPRRRPRAPAGDPPRPVPESPAPDAGRPPSVP